VALVFIHPVINQNLREFLLLHFEYFFVSKKSRILKFCGSLSTFESGLFEMVIGLVKNLRLTASAASPDVRKLR
jgi:hypothetical protein